MIKIDKTLPLHDFPDMYNRNNQDLLDIITDLQKKLTDAETQHKEDINNLTSMYNSAIANIKKSFDEKMAEFEKKFVNIDGFEQSVKQIINQNTNSK